MTQIWTLATAVPVFIQHTYILLVIIRIHITVDIQQLDYILLFEDVLATTVETFVSMVINVLSKVQ